MYVCMYTVVLELPLNDLLTVDDTAAFRWSSEWCG